MLNVVNVKRSYGKDVYLLDGVSFDIDGKGIYAVLGDKLSGKTALARIICGCEDADEGEILLDGERVGRKNLLLRSKVRLVPSQLELYPSVTPIEHLDFVGGALGVDPDKKYRQIKEALELVGLDEKQNKPFSTLDAYDRCCLSIASALLGNPRVIVMDDPFSFVDGSRMEMLCNLLKMLGDIKTVILLTRKPSDVKKLCQHVFILHNGKIALGGTIDDIMAKVNSTSQFYITVRGNSAEMLESLCAVDTVIQAKVTGAQAGGVISVYVEHRPDGMIKDKVTHALSDIGAEMLTFVPVSVDFEDVFNSFRTRSKKADAGNGRRSGGKRA